MSASAERHTLLGVSGGVFLCTFDASALNIALPAVARGLGVGAGDARWLVVLYTLVVAALLLPLAELGDIRGRRRVYYFGLLLFVGTAPLVALSPSLLVLGALRAVQAAGACALAALGVSIAAEAVSDARRGRAIGVVGSAVALGLAAGPLLGGLAVAAAGFRGVFLLVVPPGVALLWLLRGFRHRSSGPLRRFELVALASKLRDFARWPLVAPLVAGALAFVVLAASAVSVPFFLEHSLHVAPAVAGPVVAALPVTAGLVSPVAGTLADRFGARAVTFFGIAGMASACALLATLDGETSALGIALRLAVLGAAIGTFQTANKTTVIGAVPPSRTGLASGLLSLSRTLGQALGVAGLARLALGRSATVDASELRTLYLVATVLSLAALGFTLLGFRRNTAQLAGPSGSGAQ